MHTRLLPNSSENYTNLISKKEQLRMKALLLLLLIVGIGKVIRTRGGSNSFYVHVTHRISLSSAATVAMRLDAFATAESGEYSSIFQ